MEHIKKNNYERSDVGDIILGTILLACTIIIILAATHYEKEEASDMFCKYLDNKDIEYKITKLDSNKKEKI